MNKIMIRSTILFLIIIWFVSCSSKLYSQQLPLYSEYMFNTIELNPAYAGYRDAIQITSMYRKQWTGFKTAPQSAFFSIDMPITKKRIGLGLKIVDDRDEVTRTFGAQFMYSFKIPMGGNSTLALGLQGGALNYKSDFTTVDVIDANDPSFSQNTSSIKLNFGTGVFFNTKKFYIGLSTPNLIRSNIRAKLNDTKQNMHVYFNTGYIFTLSEGLLIKPSILLRGVAGSPVSFDLNVNVWMAEVLSLGVSYRERSAVVGLVDLKILPNLRMGYAYDHNISRFKLISRGSHEVILRYEIPLKGVAIVSPRYF